MARSGEEEHQQSKSAARRMGIAALFLSMSILLSRVLGFMRDVIITRQHGASVATDAYYAAFTLPEVMNYFLAGGTLSIIFIPMFSAYMARDDEEAGWRLFSIVATTMGGALLVCTAMAYVLAPEIVPQLIPFKDPVQVALTVEMTRIVLPAQLAFFIGGLLQATLFVRETFWPAALAPLVYNLCIILGGVCLEPWLGIQGFSVGALLGAVLGPLGVPLFASRRHVNYRFIFEPSDAGFSKYLGLTLPLMFGATLMTVDEWLLRYFGAGDPAGTITWLNHARKLMMVLFAVIGQAAGQAALPYLTRLFQEGKQEEMGEMLSMSLQRVVFLALVGSAGLAAISWPLVHTLFLNGAFTAVDAKHTSELLLIFCTGLTSFSVQALVVRGFYARENTLFPMIIGTVVLAVMCPIYWVLHEFFGAAGLACATTVGISLNAIATILVYKMKMGVLPLKPVSRSILRASVFMLVCGGGSSTVSWLFEQHMQMTQFTQALLALFVSSITFALLAMPLLWWMKPPEFEVVREKFVRKLRPS